MNDNSEETRTIYVTESGEFLYQDGNAGGMMTVVDNEGLSIYFFQNLQD